MNRAVSVVIPTYNGLALLQKNLPAVLSCLRAGDELIVVDDASSDATVEWLKSTARQLVAAKNSELAIVHNHYNLRFGAAVNKGVQQAKHELIFLINNDVSPRPDVLQQLTLHFNDPQVFAVGCLEIEKDSSNARGGKNKLWFERGLFIHSRAEEFTAGPTAWASGGSAMFDKQKWVQLGGFSKTFYPAYWEDIDLSFRARKKGWQVLFEPKAIVDHNHETTNGDVFGQQRIERMSWRNAHRFVWKNGTIWQKVANLMWRPYWLVRRFYH